VINDGLLILGDLTNNLDTMTRRHSGDCLHPSFIPKKVLQMLVSPYRKEEEEEEERGNSKLCYIPMSFPCITLTPIFPAFSLDRLQIKLH